MGDSISSDGLGTGHDEKRYCVLRPYVRLPWVMKTYFWLVICQYDAEILRSPGSVCKAVSALVPRFMLVCSPKTCGFVMQYIIAPRMVLG